MQIALKLNSFAYIIRPTLLSMIKKVIAEGHTMIHPFEATFSSTSYENFISSSNSTPTTTFCFT